MSEHYFPSETKIEPAIMEGNKKAENLGLTQLYNLSLQTKNML